MTIGIYQIRNVENGRVYVGSSINVEKRIQSHRSLLKAGKHHSPALQRSYSLHPDRFRFELLQVVSDSEDLIQREQYWIDALESYGSGGYNGKPLAGRNQRGREVSEETRAKMSAARMGRPSPMKGKTFGPEFRAKCSAWQQDKVVPREWIERMARANAGRPLSEARRTKIAAALKGSKRGPMASSHRARIAAALKAKGIRRSAEHCAAISAAQKARNRGPIPPGIRARMSESHKARPAFTSEHRANIRAARLAYLARQRELVSA